MRRTKTRHIAGVLLAALSTVGSSCASPSVHQEYHEETGALTVRAGPIRVGTLGLIDIYFTADVESAFRNPTPPREVKIEFLRQDFYQVHFHADGEIHTFGHRLFEEYVAIADPARVADIARARSVSVRFEPRGATFELTREDLALLRQFARAVGILPPEDAR